MDSLQILKGAQFAAEAKRRGLTLDQAVELALSEMPADIDDYRTIPNTEVQYGEFGNQDELQNFGGLSREKRIKNIEQQLTEREKVKPASDPNEVSRTFFEKGSRTPQRETVVLGPNEPMPERFRESAKVRDFGLMRKDVPAPAGQIMQQALADVNLGINQYGSDAFGSVPAPQRGVGPDTKADPQGRTYTPENITLASVAGRLEDQIRPNNDAQRSLVSGLVRQEREGMPTEERQRRANRILGLQFDEQPPEYASNPADPEKRGSLIRSSRQAPAPGAREAREAELMADLTRIRRNAEMVEANDWRANAVAQEIAQRRFGINGGGAQADQALENIGLIGKIGHAKNAADFSVSNNPVDRGGVPNYLPIDLAESYNSPQTDNRFAGPLQKQQQFLVDNIPGFAAMEQTGNFPQVSINEQLGAAREAIGNARVQKQAVDLSGTPITNLDELQAAAQQVVDLADAKGATLFRREGGRAGKNVPITNPGIAAVLERGGMNQRQVGDVAAALFQIEAARRNPLNQAKKELFGAGAAQPERPVVFGGDHPLLGGGAAKIGMLRGEKVEGKEVRGQLQALTGRKDRDGGDLPAFDRLDSGELKQARMPFIGVEAGKTPPRAQFVRGGDRGLSPQELIGKYGQANGEIAAQIISRFEQQTGIKTDGFGMSDRKGLKPNEDQRGPRRIGDDIKNQLAELNSGAYQGPTRPLTNELRGELAALGGGSRGGGGGSRGGYMTAADGPNDQPRRERYIDSIVGGLRNAPKNFRAARPRTQAAAAAGGALLGAVGLDRLFTDETERRQQEVYR